MENARFFGGRIWGVLALTLVLFHSAEADYFLISKFAGTASSSGFDGDGGQATAAKLNGPYSSTLDTAGVMVIAEYYNKRVRQVDTSGIISTVFGTSSSTLAGDNGAATAASGGVSHVQPDSAGNLYLADSSNFRIRKISGGKISAVAGGGTSFTDGIAATSTFLTSVYDVVPDSVGNVYVSGLTAKVKKVVVSTGLIYTVAGTDIPVSTEGVGLNGDGGPATSAQVNQPFNMFIDSVSRLYFTSFSLTSVRRIDLSTGIISFVAGKSVAFNSGDGGPATSAGLSAGPGVSGDTVGNVYISGIDGYTRKVDSSGIINRIAGGGILSGSAIDGAVSTKVTIGMVNSIYVRGDKLIVPDATYHTVYVVSLIPYTYAPTELPSTFPTRSPTGRPTSPSVVPTLSPSALPSCIPSVVPTASYDPTIEPSLMPTASTTVPSAVPSELPTFVPSAGPSQAPTVAPSKLPSAAPSGVLTSLPTVIPTAPTKKPTALPSVRPTRQMISNSPTVGTTSAPTAAPTTHVDISFDANLYLFNTTDSALTSADASAVTTAVANTLNVTSGVSVANSGLVGSGRRLTAAGPPYNLWVLVNVHASTADHVGMNGSALFHHLKGALLAAEMSNELNSALAEAAHTYSAYGLYYVSDVNLTVSAYSVIPVAVDSTSDGEDKRLSRGDIAGVVIGVLVSFMVLTACCYFAANSYASAVKRVDPQTDVEKA